MKSNFLINVLIFLALLIFPTVLQGQSNKLYGLSWIPSQSQWYLVTVDPYTGSENKIDTIPNLISVTSEGILDTDSNRYLFSGQDVIGGVDYYYLLDINTGEIISKTAVSENVNYPIYHSGTKKFYGLYWDDILSVEYFVSLNPFTATITKIDSISGVQVILGGGVVNTDSSQYVFSGTYSGGSVYNYYILDILTGNTLKVTPYTVYSDFISYHSNDKKYYGISSDNPLSKFFFVSIDPFSGVTTLIDSIPQAAAITRGGVIDPDSSVYIIQGMNSPGGQQYYYILDIASGTNISTAICQSEVYGLEYKTKNINSINERIFNSEFLTAPNPMNYSASFEVAKDLSQVLLIDLNGNIKRKYENIPPGSFTIFKAELQPGFYFITAIDKMGNIKTGKLIIL